MIGDDLDLGHFMVWNQVTDAMKWRRGRYGRECSLGRSASGADGRVWNLRILGRFRLDSY